MKRVEPQLVDSGIFPPALRQKSSWIRQYSLRFFLDQTKIYSLSTASHREWDHFHGFLGAEEVMGSPKSHLFGERRNRHTSTRAVTLERSQRVRRVTTIWRVAIDDKPIKTENDSLSAIEFDSLHPKHWSKHMVGEGLWGVVQIYDLVYNSHATALQERIHPWLAKRHSAPPTMVFVVFP